MCVHSSWHCAQNRRKSPLHFSRRLTEPPKMSRTENISRVVDCHCAFAFIKFICVSYFGIAWARILVAQIDVRVWYIVVHAPDCVIVCALCLTEKFLICAIVGRTKEHTADVPLDWVRPRVCVCVVPSYPVSQYPHWNKEKPRMKWQYVPGD